MGSCLFSVLVIQILTGAGDYRELDEQIACADSGPCHQLLRPSKQLLFSCTDQHFDESLSALFALPLNALCTKSSQSSVQFGLNKHHKEGIFLFYVNWSCVLMVKTGGMLEVQKTNESRKSFYSQSNPSDQQPVWKTHPWWAYKSNISLSSAASILLSVVIVISGSTRPS